MTRFEDAEALLQQFKGSDYLHGLGVLPEAGHVVATVGSRAALVRSASDWAKRLVDTVKRSLASAGIELTGEVDGARPNAPREDLRRIVSELHALDADVIVGLGGGSTLDATKAAVVLQELGGEIEDYFGTGIVSETLAAREKNLTSLVAIQTAAGSAAHLTKYSNITDLETGQKKLLVDEAIIPDKSVFDYEATLTAPPDLTADSALDGVAHSLEVLYGAVGSEQYALIERVATEAIRLVVEYLPVVANDPKNAEGRRALGLATDLGGYAIMLGGTNGGHLTSFSLVSLLPHGRACAIMNPYYTVFFAPAIESPLRSIGRILCEAGYCDADVEKLSGRELGLAVARALITFQESAGLPTTLGDVPGFHDRYIKQALEAAKDPQLKMKLENMPVPLTSPMIDEYMGSILTAAKTGDLASVRNVK
jgi:alcohol dehydrogenase